MKERYKIMMTYILTQVVNGVVNYLGEVSLTPSQAEKVQLDGFRLEIVK